MDAAILRNYRELRYVAQDLASLVREYVITCQGDHNVNNCDVCSHQSLCYKLKKLDEYTRVMEANLDES